MKSKMIGICLCLLCFLTVFISCAKKDVQEPAITKPAQIESPSVTETTTATTEKETSALPTDKPVTLYTQKASNPYIQKVAKQYGVEEKKLVALIRTNTNTPGATVLEFSGVTDANGNLLMTNDTLVAVYDIHDRENTIRKATVSGQNTDGYTKGENDAVIALAKRFMLKEIPKLKAERTSEKFS